MPGIKVPTNFNIELDFEIPEFYRRLVALLIDLAIKFFYFMIAREIYNQIVEKSWRAGTTENLHWIWLIFLMPLMIYHVVMEITMNGQTPGKKIMGLRIVDENGGRASFSQFFIRWLLRVSDLWIIFILILLLTLGSQSIENIFIFLFGFTFLVTDIVLVVSSKKGQRIGDLLAHTILIRTNTNADITETVFQEVEDSYIPSFPQIMNLSDRDINAIKSILETSVKRNDYDMAYNASEKIKSHLKIDTNLAPFDFLSILLKDYNYLSTK